MAPTKLYYSATFKGIPPYRQISCPEQDEKLDFCPKQEDKGSMQSTTQCVLQDASLKDDWFDDTYYNPEDPVQMQEAFNRLEKHKKDFPRLFFRIIIRTETVIKE